MVAPIFTLTEDAIHSGLIDGFPASQSGGVAVKVAVVCSEAFT